jgi:biopolymer transport protein ExbB/TolQ
MLLDRCREGIIGNPVKLGDEPIAVIPKKCETPFQENLVFPSNNRSLADVVKLGRLDGKRISQKTCLSHHGLYKRRTGHRRHEFTLYITISRINGHPGSLNMVIRVFLYHYSLPNHFEETTLPDYSISHMFLNADRVVQGVMILLLLASIASWVVMLEKAMLLKQSSVAVWRFKKIAAALTNSVDPNEFPGFTAKIVESGVNESKDTAGHETRSDFRERLERAMRVILSGRIDRLENRVNLLATVGSTSPFVGLFGTVWGIMHSFIGIAAKGETTLAVVAPGIAEALFATAMGLVAAIPAVIAFNKINSTMQKMTKEALAGIALVGNALSRIHFTEEDQSSSPTQMPGPERSNMTLSKN